MLVRFALNTLFSMFVTLFVGYLFASDDDSDGNASFAGTEFECPSIPAGTHASTVELTEQEKQDLESFADSGQLFHWNYPQCESQVMTLRVDGSWQRLIDVFKKDSAGLVLARKAKQFHVLNPEVATWTFFSQLSDMLQDGDIPVYAIHIFGEVRGDIKECLLAMSDSLQRKNFTVSTLDYALQLVDDESRKALLDHLVGLGNQSELKTLSVRWCGLKDRDLDLFMGQLLANFPNLTHLGFPFNGLTDVIMKDGAPINLCINQLKSLRQLDLRGNELTDTTSWILGRSGIPKRKMLLQFNSIDVTRVQSLDKFKKGCFSYIYDQRQDKAQLMRWKEFWVNSSRESESDFFSKDWGEKLSCYPLDLADLWLLLGKSVNNKKLRKIDLSEMCSDSSALCLSYFLQALPLEFVQQLLLKKNNFGQLPGGDKVLNVMQTFKKLITLDLSDNDFSTEDWGHFAETCNYQNLKALYLRGLNLQKEFVAIGLSNLLTRADEKFPNLEVLDLGEAKVTSLDDLDVIWADESRLHLHPKLKVINLDKIAGVKDVTAEYLSRLLNYLSKSHPLYVNLFGTAILKEQQVAILDKGMRENDSMLSVMISGKFQLLPVFLNTCAKGIERETDMLTGNFSVKPFYNRSFLEVAHYFQTCGYDSQPSLDGISCITKLDLRGTKKMDSTDARHLKGLITLEELNLDGHSISDSGAQYLSHLKFLKRLNLCANNIGPSGVQYLKDLTTLEEINLNSNHIGPDGMQYLKDLTSMTALFLYDNGIYDDGVRCLENLTKLKKLVLQSNGLSGMSVEYLSKLKSLEFINLVGNEISVADVASLKRKLVKATIEI